jgi:hypothetical protein
MLLHTYHKFYTVRKQLTDLVQPLFFMSSVCATVSLINSCCLYFFHAYSYVYLSHTAILIVIFKHDILFFALLICYLF